MPSPPSSGFPTASAIDYIVEHMDFSNFWIVKKFYLSTELMHFHYSYMYREHVKCISCKTVLHLSWKINLAAQSHHFHMAWLVGIEYTLYFTYSLDYTACLPCWYLNLSPHSLAWYQLSIAPSSQSWATSTTLQMHVTLNTHSSCRWGSWLGGSADVSWAHLHICQLI
jgi:hypothetical protein